MLRTAGLILAGAILGGAIGIAVTLLVRGGDNTTKRTAPDIVKALRASEGEWCTDKEVDTPTAGGFTSYRLYSPVRANSGDWYTGCSVLAIGPIHGEFSYCFRVKPETLEVVMLQNEPRNVTAPCESYPGWPNP
jgi:hypothetical protein